MRCLACMNFPAMFGVFCGRCRADEDPEDFRPASLPTTPTEALPGTSAKVRILTVRAGCRMSLWHPRDAAFHGRRESPGADALLRLLRGELFQDMKGRRRCQHRGGAA
jgi:hypothetical protein